jgi:uncharacterized membrane protein
VKTIAENEESDESISEDGIVPGRTLIVVLAGFAIIFVGVVLIVIAALLNSNSGSVGGVIFIGPFPIVFGIGPDAIWLIAISIIIAIMMLVLFYIWRRRSL